MKILIVHEPVKDYDLRPDYSLNEPKVFDPFENPKKSSSKKKLLKW